MTSTHLRDELGRSRKAHVCQLCGRKIRPETKRVKRYFKSDGEFITSHMHIECEAKTAKWEIVDWETHIIGEGDWPELSE